MDVKVKEAFLRNGFAALNCLIDAAEVEKIRMIYDSLLNDRTLTSGLRSDLSGEDSNPNEQERITQIMRPSMVVPGLAECQVYKSALDHAQNLLGHDMDLDFDMLINKVPHTNTPTPWHQDAAYWIDLPDQRSVSCWVALDDVFEENGCMWFIAKEDDHIRPHKQNTKGGALSCEADIEQAKCIPLKAGGCTFHDGHTLHYSNGNSTDSQRRALILNFRPKEMIELERKRGVDHTGERKVRNG